MLKRMAIQVRLSTLIFKKSGKFKIRERKMLKIF